MTTRSRLRARAVTTAITLACVVLAAVGLRLSERDDNFQVVRGTLGSPAVVNEGTVTVDDVRVGGSLVEGGEVTSRTPGMFVVVNVTAAATGSDSLVLGRSQLLSGDRVYHSYSALSTISAVPGFQTRVDLVFEVDPNRIDNLTIELWRNEIVSGYHQRVRVPLRITPRNADQWRTRAHRLITEPETRPTTRVIP
jgi:hypothetical protein